MNIEQMRMVLALAESGNMTTTARKLQLTQPALTYQLKTIESELGFPLFKRDRAGTALTPEGAFLCETLHKLVTEYDEGVRLSRAIAKGTASGNMRVGTDASSRDTVSAFLRATHAAQDTQHVSLIPCGTRKPVELLHEGLIDFWSTSQFNFELCSTDDLQFLPLGHAESMVYIPQQNPLSGKEYIEAEDLAGQTVWMWPYKSMSATSDALRDELAQRNIRLDIRDFTREASPLLATLAGGALAIYDTGFLPPPSHLACAVPLASNQTDQLGLVFARKDYTRLAKTIDSIKKELAGYANATGDALKAGHITAIFDDIVKCICRGGTDDIVPLLHYALDMGAPADHILNRGVFAGMDAASKLYQEGAAYTNEMIAAVETCKRAAEELTPLLPKDDSSHTIGSAVIGTMQGDKHELGKNLVRIALEGRGIDVCDLGAQVAPQQFVEYLKQNANCNLVLISLSRTEMRDKVRETMEALMQARLRDRVFIMIGGPAASQDFCTEIGADAYTEDAQQAAQTAFNLLNY